MRGRSSMWSARIMKYWRGVFFVIPFFLSFVQVAGDDMALLSGIRSHKELMLRRTAQPFAVSRPCAAIVRIAFTIVNSNVPDHKVAFLSSMLTGKLFFSLLCLGIVA